MKIYYGSIKTDGKVYLMEENLYVCTEKCYQKFYSDTSYSLYEKQDINEKKDNVWTSVCKRCGHSCINNTMNTNFEEDLKENVLKRFQVMSTQSEAH